MAFDFESSHLLTVRARAVEPNRAASAEHPETRAGLERALRNLEGAKTQKQ